MKKHRPKINCNLLTPTEVFQLVLAGRLKTFPSGFWSDSDGMENALEILRYLLESVLQWSPDDIKKKYTKNLFAEYKLLSGMLKRIFNGSPYQALNALYPNQFKEWELQKTPHSFWSKETGIQATRWLIEEKLKWMDEDIKKKLSKKVFIEHKLLGMLSGLYHTSVWQAINAAYPNRFKEWELRNTPVKFWNTETGIRATKWLIEEKLKWTENDIKEKIDINIFISNGLLGMLQIVFHGSVWQTINMAYPGRFKEWELRKAPINFWNEETGIRATKWLIEEKLKWSIDDIKDKLSHKVFFDNGLRGMIGKVYNGSPWQAINAAYPNQFKEWEFQQVPNGFWNNETGIRAIKWLFEEKLKWSEEDIKENLTIKVFSENKLLGMLSILYNTSPWQAINAAYPNRFKEWELKNAPSGFWNEETATRAVRWLFEEKLKWTWEEIKENISQKVFIDNGFSAMFQIFNNSPWQAVNAAYPGRFKEWELKQVPNGFWNHETAIRATKWLIEEKLKWTGDDIKEKISQKVFFYNGLAGMISNVYRGGVWQAINAAYPNRFKEWEFQQSPNGFWNEETGIRATKWLFEEKLKWTEDDMKEKVTQKVFADNGLSGMLQTLYHTSPWQAINTAYPNRFKEWELRRVPLHFWNEETGIRATKWLIEEKLKWSEDEIKEQIDFYVFNYHGLTGMLGNLYNNSPWQAINAAYPNRFKEWDFQKVPLHFWNEETGIRATKWLIEEKLKWTEDDIRGKINKRIFDRHRFTGMLNSVYGGSLWLAINAAYPAQFKEWELQKIPAHFWSKETGIRAVKWLIEEKLKWTDYEIKEYLRLQIFYTYGLRTMMATIFHNSPFEALNAAYPGRFLKYQLRYRNPDRKTSRICPEALAAKTLAVPNDDVMIRFRECHAKNKYDLLSPVEIYQLVLAGELEKFPNEFWTGSNARENAVAILKYLFKSILQWSSDDFKKNYSRRLLIEYKLNGLLTDVFNGSPFLAIDIVYPHQFQKWEVQYMPKDYWNYETGIQATRWLIEEKLKWTDLEIKKFLRMQTFKDHGLANMVVKIFHKSPYLAIEAAYPGRFQRSDFYRGPKKLEYIGY